MLESTARIQQELEALRRLDPDGNLYVKVVHDWAATHPSSALHEELEWEDAKAGYRYRLDQIRRLIAIHVVDDTGQRTMISLSIDRHAGGGYRPLDRILPDRDLRRVMLKDALDDFNRFHIKYQRLTEMSRLFDEGQRIAELERRRQDQLEGGTVKSPARKGPDRKAGRKRRRQ
jgi:hypothetical protein